MRLRAALVGVDSARVAGRTSPVDSTQAEAAAVA